MGRTLRGCSAPLVHCPPGKTACHCDICVAPDAVEDMACDAGTHGTGDMTMSDRDTASESLLHQLIKTRAAARLQPADTNCQEGWCTCQLMLQALLLDAGLILQLALRLRLSRQRGLMLWYLHQPHVA